MRRSACPERETIKCLSWVAHGRVAHTMVEWLMQRSGGTYNGLLEACNEAA